ncbi:MAG: VOC family protein [SAR324 cluster bacterium]|nr:VOC family protein [SAR324 cluster bacterium]
MSEHLHHAHIFASDMEATVAWWRDMLGGEVCFDGDFGGARNVFMKVGAGRLHIYDQPPRGAGRNTSIHHLGIRTDDLHALAARLRGKGVSLRSAPRDFGAWKYLMCMAPDNVLLELFQIDTAQAPPELAAYFGE